MRFRLLRRRLTISAPSMAIRSSLPWPLKWGIAAVVLGFCGAIALWAFEFGKGIAGIDQGQKEQLAALKVEVAKLREERDKAQSLANVANVSITTERATQETLLQRVKQLESDNQTLRDDLGFFERLIPSTTAEPLAIRGLQAEMLTPTQLKWQVLIVQSSKHPREFTGRLDITLSGVLAGRPWSAKVTNTDLALQVKQFRRVNGVVDLPQQVQVKLISIKVLDSNGGAIARATQTLKL